LEKLILGSKIQVFFGLYPESPWMWRQNGDRDLLRKIDTLSKRTGDQAGASGAELGDAGQGQTVIANETTNKMSCQVDSYCLKIKQNCSLKCHKRRFEI
jgi:hypothetical protein